MTWGHGPGGKVKSAKALSPQQRPQRGGVFPPPLQNLVTVQSKTHPASGTRASERGPGGRASTVWPPLSSAPLTQTHTPQSTGSPVSLGGRTPGGTPPKKPSHNRRQTMGGGGGERTRRRPTRCAHAHKKIPLVPHGGRCRRRQQLWHALPSRVPQPRGHLHAVPAPPPFARPAARPPTGWPAADRLSGVSAPAHPLRPRADTRA